MKSLALIPLQIIRGSESETIEVEVGSNLRQVLLAHAYSPYTKVTHRLNCGGRGLCATCGVWILENEPEPLHWHDQLAAQFRYPRLSCQITITHPMTISLLTDKVIWGKRKPKKNNRSE